MGALSTAIFSIQEMLKDNYDLSNGERILSVPVKVVVDNEGYIIKEELYSLKDEYNNALQDQYS